MNPPAQKSQEQLAIIDRLIREIENETLWQYAKNRQLSPKNLTTLKEFNEIIKCINKSIDTLAEVKQSCIYEDRESDAEFIDAQLESLIKEKYEMIDKKEKMRLKKKLGTGDKIIYNIELAKSIPLDRILKFNSAGFAHCIYNPEKTPSLKWYKKDNRFHCFSCEMHGDAIDLVRQDQKLSFLQAVEFLSKL